MVSVLHFFSKPQGVADLVDDRPGLDKQEAGLGTACLEETWETWKRLGVLTFVEFFLSQNPAVQLRADRGEDCGRMQFHLELDV